MEQDKELVIEESKEDSDVVELPEEEVAVEELAESVEPAAVTPDADEEDNPNDTDAVREAKRQKRRARKEYHKQVQHEKDTRLQLLQRQNQELMERLSVVERRTHGSEIARVNEAVKEQEARILFARTKIKEAAETGNGDLLLSAQDMLYEARRNHEALENLRRQAVTPRAQQQTIQAPNQAVQQHAARWMSKNDWYNANGSDMDSKIAKDVDQELAEEGWNPGTREYWEELDNRLHKYLPHRYNDDNEDEDYRRTKKPRSVVTSTGRESVASGKVAYTVTPEQKRAMMDAGYWDDPDKRMKMIKRYAKEGKLQRN